MKKIYYGALLLAVSMLFASCGGGGGGGDSGQTSVAPATVGLVITDASTDDWDKALATITSVVLIGNDGQEQIFSGEKVVDLLALREHVKLFSVKNGVRPGYYSKIRLYIKKLVLVRENDPGPPIEQEVKVPSGKVDLNPKETIYIAPGATVFASLDWDMEKSLKLTETGSGKWIMRPMIFVHIGTKPVFKQGLVRLSGMVDTVGDVGFRLCSAPTVSTLSTVTKDFCVNVLVKDITGVFDDKGEPRVDQKVTVGEELTVLGLLRRTEDDHHDYDDDDDDEYEHHDHASPFSKDDRDDDDDDDERPRFLVSAIVVEVGPEGTWERIRGVLTKTVDSVSKQFELDPDAGQGYDDTTLLTAQLFDQSRVFRLNADGTIDKITPGDLLLNDRASLDAVKLASTGSGPDLNVAVMLARPATATETLTGTVMSVSSLGDWVVIDDGVPCVATSNITTRVFLLSDSGVKEIVVTDLPVGSSAVVTATGRTPSDCLNADVIVAKAPASS